MEKTKYIWFNGKFIPWESAKTHVLTHALHYGTGVFEGIRCYPALKNIGALFRLKDHIKRFFYSCGFLNMKIPFSLKEIENAVIATVKKNGVRDVYVRPFAYYDYYKIGPNPADSPVTVIIACIPLKDYLKGDFIRVKTAKFRRIPPISTNPHTKISGMYFNSALASLEAWKAGFNEALVLDQKGYVVEGAAENIFMVKNGKLFTPPAFNILPGITRNSIIQIANDLGIKCYEKRILPAVLKKADEVFFTGTGAEITAIGQIDGVKLSMSNPITRGLQIRYNKIVRGEIPAYRKWLTFIN